MALVLWVAVWKPLVMIRIQEYTEAQAQGIMDGQSAVKVHNLLEQASLIN